MSGGPVRFPVRFEAGAEGGEAEAYAEGVLTVVSPRAYAPGAPIGLEVGVSGEPAPPLGLAGRTIGSKRREDGRYTVRIRLTNLRRAEREALERHLAP